MIMQPLAITPIYTLLIVFMFIPLALKIIKLRRRHRVSLLDGNHGDLTRAIRAHGNFSEYVPLSLLILAFYEINQAPDILLHILGATLLASRLFHAYGIHKKALRPRQIGMYLTFATLIGGSLALISTIINL